MSINGHCQDSRSLSYDSLNTIHTIQGKKTTVEGLRFYETAMDLFKYIYKKTIVDTAGATMGYLFMLAEPKHYKSEALYPELFRKSEDFSFERSFSYAYAVYNQRQLSTHINDYPFPPRSTETKFHLRKLKSSIEMGSVNFGLNPATRRSS